MVPPDNVSMVRRGGSKPLPYEYEIEKGPATPVAGPKKGISTKEET